MKINWNFFNRPKSESKSQAIRKTARENHKDKVISLLQNKKICRYDANNYLIRKASVSGWTGIVKRLLKESKTNRQIDPSAYFNQAIKWASAGGHTDVVKLLLQDKRVDPAAESNFAIRWASAGGHTDVVKLLLQDKRVDPSDYNNYAIRSASENEHTNVIVELLLYEKLIHLPKTSLLRFGHVRIIISKLWNCYDKIRRH